MGSVVVQARVACCGARAVCACYASRGGVSAPGVGGGQCELGEGRGVCLGYVGVVAVAWWCSSAHCVLCRGFGCRVCGRGWGLVAWAGRAAVCVVVNVGASVVVCSWAPGGSGWVVRWRAWGAESRVG